MKGGGIPKRGLARRVLVVALGALVAVVLAALFLPTGFAPVMPSGWSPIRDDGLAALFAPNVVCAEKYGKIEAVFYRAARHDDGTVKIAYHYVWNKEENVADTFGAFLSRILYTGGLSLQRLMFGPGDVEAIGVTIAPSGAVVTVQYEEAFGYSEADMSVTHRSVADDGFDLVRDELWVASWNHLFEKRTRSDELPVDRAAEGAMDTDHLLPSYFTGADWRYYGMTKSPPTFTFRHRAHFDWEIDAIE